MKRREFLAACAAAPVLPLPAAAPPPIEEPHFPSRLHQFVWRNWELANADRMAQVIGTTADKVLELGQSMGLPRKRTLSADQLRRIYITAIRQNWHLLPEEQIIQLLGWDREKFAFTLKEDDFLNIKLGRQKPECARLRYQPPLAEHTAAARRIRRIVRQNLGSAIDDPGQDLLHFVRELSDQSYVLVRDRSAAPSAEDLDLSRGWRVEAPREEILGRAARRLEQYMSTAMEANLNGPRPIRLTLSSSIPPESFRVTAATDAITISGGGERGILEGIYWMQDEMEARGGPFLRPGNTGRKTVWNPRYLYSYFALYGDPLIETDIDPFPDGYLEKLARAGINGVWMQAVLTTLAPSRHFPEFGQGAEIRLKNLNALVQRAKQFGVRVYLYINEPRAMPDAFFRKYPDIRGSRFLDVYAMCTSAPVVREWLADSLAHVMRRVPDLGGWFSITMSENHTNCFSHGGAWGKQAPVVKDCPRCSRRTPWDTIAELLQTFRDGIRRESRTADVIHYDWGWGDALSEKLIPLLPRDTFVLSVSEWEAPVVRAGVKTEVGEYSISVVGPGPRALRNWKRASARGMRNLAKLQFNNTWEISAVPYIPVPHLVLDHCENLTRAGVSGAMASWTCGGYASPNLAAAKAYYFEPRQSRDEILGAVARQRYGPTAVPYVVEGWRRFSEAFQEFPYGVHVYIIPTQHGPANLLRLRPTGYPPGMILFPLDAYKQWCGPYPPEAVQQQFTRLAQRWNDGLAVFRRGLEKIPATRRTAAALDLAIAETCYNHFQSTANQVEFYILRSRLDGPAKNAALDRMRAIAEHEIQLAKRQFPLARRQSAIAYEASNHYYYTPLDLVEKILNCRHLIDRQIPEARS